MAENKRLPVKFLLVGDPDVGKTSLICRFTLPNFDPSVGVTQGIDTTSVETDIDGNPYKLMYWDTAGQERFRTITSTFYRGAQGIALVFDITNENSFNQIKNWYTETERYCNKNCSRILIGNKTDLEENRAVTYEAASNFANEHDLDYFETSIMDAESVSKAFLELARKTIRKGCIDDIDSLIIDEPKPKPHSKACCA